MKNRNIFSLLHFWRQKQIPIITLLLMSIVFSTVSIHAQTDASQVTYPTKAQLQPHVADLRIVHLSAPNADLSEFTSLERMIEFVDAETLHYWSQVELAHLVEPIDVLIIDNSAGVIVDHEELSRLYDLGTVIVGMNMQATELESLFNDGCVSLSAMAEYEQAAYIMISFKLEGENNQEVQEVLASYRNTCGNWTEENLPDVDGYVSVGSQQSTDSMTSEINFDLFLYNILIHAHGIEDATKLVEGV